MTNSDNVRPSSMPLNEQPWLDCVALVAARLFEAPIALVSLVEDGRECIKGRLGIDLTETLRDFPFCNSALHEAEPTVVCDASNDPQFLNHPLVTGEPFIQFYVGTVVLSSQGIPLGTLSVIDRLARSRPSQQLLEHLKDVASLTASIAANTAADRLLQEQQRKAVDKAERANRAKSDFLARMSHEIRTPMNLIMGMNALLLESPLNERQRLHIEVSHSNVRRLLHLVNGILDLSKVEAGELHFHNIPFSLDEVLTECTATISSAVERKGLQLQVSVDPAAGRYWSGDAERLQQVLLNLIGNSLKFTRIGSIEVSVGTVINSEGIGGLRFEVIDTGCGVPANKARVIFEAFQRGEDSNGQQYEGTGLGLSIAKSLVEKMGGRIWIAEKQGQGARFVFTVFLQPATEAAVLERKAKDLRVVPPQKVAPGTRLLLVEDNPENIILMRAYLDNLGLAIDIASSGEEALEKRRQNTYDVVLMDIEMPIMDGYAASRAMRLWEKTNHAVHVPIVALTAHAFVGAAADSMKAGCDAHLTKPVDRYDLLETIAKHARIPQGESVDEVEDSIATYRPIYLAKRQADLEKMRTALDSANFATIQTIGHNCKGTGNGFGFPEISALGMNIEKAAKASDEGRLRECIDSLERFVTSASATSTTKMPVT